MLQRPWRGERIVGSKVRPEIHIRECEGNLCRALGHQETKEDVAEEGRRN